MTTLAVTAVPPYPLPTYNSPRKPSGSKGGLSPTEPVCSAKLDDSEYRLEPVTYKYSTANPVLFTFLAFNISPTENPLALATLIVTDVSDIVGSPTSILPLTSLIASN